MLDDQRVREARTICFDTAPLIYFIENHSEFADLVAPLMEAVASGEKRGLSSYITLIEILVEPLRQGREDLAAEYRERLLQSPSFRLFEVGERIAEEAARLRGQHNLKTPDAIQMATARLSRAEVFVTNDGDFRGIPGMPIVILGDNLD